jgi:hypothetical protein
MSLRDEHLAKALKHAPDSDLAPSETVRKKVLEHAKLSGQKPRKHWLAGLLPNMKNWQWAGMSSVAVALLAMLMLREQLPPEMTQPEPAPKVLAQNSASDKALKEERADMPAATASIQAEAPARNINRKAKTETPDAAPEMADKTVIAALPEALAPPAPVQATAEQELAKQDDSVVAQNTARVEAAPAASPPASDAIASAEQKSEAENSNAAAKKSVMLVDASALGVAKANRDIQAGVLRILVAEWPADKSLLDEATGYRVEVVTDLVAEELAAYNQTMRDWFNTQH